jgi:hypothetical protein
MPTKIAHTALVDRLRAMTKAAENEGEAKLKTQHPSGSDSANDDQTQDTPVGARYQEQTEENREMYPKGTASDTKNEEGTQESDPGHNRGVKVRASGEIPEVDQGHLLNDPQDPGSGHPSGTAKVSAVEEAQQLSTDLREVAGELAKIATSLTEGETGGGGSSDEYLSGGEEGEPAPPEGHEENQTGTSAYPEGDTSEVTVTKGEASDGGEKSAEELGAEEAEKLAAYHAELEEGTRDLISSIQKSADFDAEFFTGFLGGVVNKLSPQEPTQKLAEDEESESGEKKEDNAEESSDDSSSESSAPPSSEEVPGAEEAAPAAPEGGGGDVLADMAGLGAAPPEAGGGGDPLAALAGGEAGGDPLATLGGGGGAMPPGMGGEEIPPEMMGEAPPEMGMGMGEESGLTPEEEALLLQALMGQGMDEGSIADYAKMGHDLSKGVKLSSARETYFKDLSTRVEAAKEAVRNTKAASTLADELKLIGKGI